MTTMKSPLSCIRTKVFQLFMIYAIYVRVTVFLNLVYPNAFWINAKGVNSLGVVMILYLN